MEDCESNWNEAETTLSSSEGTQDNTGIYSCAYCHWSQQSKVRMNFFLKYEFPLSFEDFSEN